MTDDTSKGLIDTLGRRYLWWQPVAELPFTEDRVVAQIMNFATYDDLLRLEAGLAIGTPALAALGFTVAALTAGLRGAGALAGLMLLPLAVPLLIFGAGAIQPDGASAMKLLAAVSLLFVTGASFAAGAALRAIRE